jgi:hypothetical protein
MTWLTIDEAAELLAVRADRPVTPTGFKHILMAGAECRLRIFWRNSQQRFSCLFGFGGAVPGSTKVLREMQIPPLALGQLETREEIDLFVFDPSDDDWLALQQVQSIDDEGHPGGFRALIDLDHARVTRDALLVQDKEVLYLAQQLEHHSFKSIDASASRDAEPRSAPEEWSIEEPSRTRGYTAAVVRLLAAAHKAGKAPPTAREMLEEWRARPPAEIFEVMSHGIKYYDAAGDPRGEADLNAIGDVIRRRVKRGGPR